MDCDGAAQTTALEDLSGAPNYQNWLAGFAQPYLGNNPLELGSGIGDYAQIWLRHGADRIYLTEADEQRLGVLRSRFADLPRVRVSTFEAALQSGERFSSLVSFNVLEHLDSPADLLAAARDSLALGAPVVSYVPAVPFAMSDFDRTIGHFRRFTKESLACELSAAGLQIETLRYVNLPGLAAWIVGMKFLKMTPGQGRALSLWDNWAIPAISRLERGRNLPIGQSLFAVARVR